MCSLTVVALVHSGRLHVDGLRHKRQHSACCRGYFASLLLYFLQVGFQHRADKFFIFAVFMMLTNLAATSLALAVRAPVR